MTDICARLPAIGSRGASSWPILSVVFVIGVRQIKGGYLFTQIPDHCLVCKLFQDKSDIFDS